MKDEIRTEMTSAPGANSMSNTPRKRKWWVIPLIAIVAVYVGVSVILGGIRQFHEYKGKQEVKRWLDQAQQDAKSTWTQDDAVSWLRQHDFELIGKGNRVSQTTGRPVETNLVAGGYRLIEKGGMILKPSCVAVTFIFDMDHRFNRAEARFLPFLPPGLDG